MTKAQYDNDELACLWDPFEQFTGANCIDLKWCCGLTRYEIARTWHLCGVSHKMPVLWLNQYSLDYVETNDGTAMFPVGWIFSPDFS